MALHHPVCYNYLLIHGRQCRGLTTLQVCRQTGIDKRKYELMEAGQYVVGEPEAELLGALLAIPPHYLVQSSICLEWMHSYKDVMRIKNEKIQALTKALKQKIRSSN